MTGQALAHYRILEKLGAGGMGVVYQARDTHLDRLVAIKVLPHDKTSDPERKRRFVQEAKSASALNHPHIVTVHDVASDAGVDFIVMEYVSGRTLAAAIGQQGLSPTDVLTYGAQIADALAAAHAAGIVHRDLKPGNVMITDRGAVKILDFGLAKLTEIAAAEDALTETAPPRTEEGAIVGTVAYMSPEQAEGKTVDARSDIFSFGAVLYEMMTGRRAFSGETKVSTLAAILHTEPPPLEHAPPELERIIRQCLRKDPARRIQHIVDVKLALEDLKAESESGVLPAVVARRPSRVGAWTIAAAAVVVLAAGTIAWRLTRAPAPRGAPTLVQLTTDTGLSTDPALSPDGKLLAYASDRAGNGNLDIWVRQVGGGEPRNVTQDSADEQEPTFSPDGTTIAFRSEQDGGGIYVVSTLGGGRARKIAPGGRRPRFSPDGSQIAYWSGGIGGVGLDVRDGCQIFVVASTGGPPRRVRADFLGAAYPEWTPEGQHLLFLGNRVEYQPGAASLDWWVTPLDQGPPIATGALIATQQEGLTGPFQGYPGAVIAPVWEAGSSSLIFAARSDDSRNLWRIGISPKTWTATGRPERLTSSSAIEERPSVVSMADGSVRIAFASLSENRDIWSQPVDPKTGSVTGEPRQLTWGSTADFFASLSPDRRKMVFISGRSGKQEIWIKDLTTGDDTALTASGMDKWGPKFSPDAMSVAFSTNHDGKWNVFLVPAGGGAAEMICEDCGQVTSWSPKDGRYLLGNDVHGRVFLLEVATRRRIDLLADKERWSDAGSFSPDGHWITFHEVRARLVHIAPFQGETVAPESTWHSVQEELGAWSADGTLVRGFSGHDGFQCLWGQRVDPATKRPVGAPFVVAHLHSLAALKASLSSHATDRRPPGSALSPDALVFDMAERTGSIWMATWNGGWR